MMKSRMGLSLLFVISVFSAHMGQQTALAQVDFRLPLNLVPTHYDVQLLVKPRAEDDFSFEGSVEVDFTCVEATDTVVIHNYGLVVDESSASLQDASGNEIAILGHEYATDYTDFHTISLDGALEVDGTYTLSMSYSGKMGFESIAGLWYGNYTGDKGEEFYVASQMQPIFTRSVFPCFDEPGLKATFDVTIGHPNDVVAFANMPLQSSSQESDAPDYVWDTFETTPVMSTYLLAMIIGEFSRAGTSDARQSILVKDESLPNTDLASQWVPAILESLETRTRVPYPLPKLDHAGVDIFFGGMENYGLIIYREDLVGAEDGSASLMVIAHETSHMWFGDLVTCQFWDVAWLNEGMTHFFTFLISDDIDDTFDHFDYLGTTLMDNAMMADVFPDTPPMVVPITTPGDISVAFDGNLVYNRGGATGRAMYYLLGEEVMFNGLNDYFVENSYKSVREEQLFGALDAAAQAAGLNLPDEFGNIMTPWTNQPGYPLVTVTRLSTSGGETVFEITQKRHLDVTGNDHNDDSLWPVPLTWSTSVDPNFEDTTPKEFLTSGSTTVTIPVDDSQWVIFNNMRAGYYRVNYDREGWLLILDAMDNGQVGEVNRAAIVSDAIELCRYELVDSDICFELQGSLANERSLTVWMAAANNMHKLILKSDNQREAVNRMREIVGKAESIIMRTREAMTPRRRNLLNFLKNYKEHLNGGKASSKYKSHYETVLEEKFEAKTAALKARFGDRRSSLH